MPRYIYTLEESVPSYILPPLRHFAVCAIENLGHSITTRDSGDTPNRLLSDSRAVSQKKRKSLHDQSSGVVRGDRFSVGEHVKDNSTSAKVTTSEDQP